MTSFPFPLPPTVLRNLPPPARDGNHYLDVRVAGKWDGVIVTDCHGLCIGVYIGRRIEACALPFAPGDIEDIRRASAWNRLLAAMPFDLWNGAVVTILILSPAALALGWLGSPLFALVSIVACSVAIHVMYLARGFPLIRFPLAVGGLCQILSAGLCLLRSLADALGR
jgi:hypothetical protein